MNYLVALIVMVVALHATNLATTVYLHRGLAHRGIRFSKLASFLFRLELWLSLGISSREWVAVHRKHHRYTDVEGDPHSPYLEGGVWKLLFTNYLHYRREARDPENLARFAKDLPPDVFDRYLFERLWLVGPTISHIVLFATVGIIPGLIAFWGHAAVYIVLSGAINSICHWFGYRNFDNTATNVGWLAWLTAGEGWHNNHHAHPSSPKLSMARGEVDPAWWFVRTLTFLRLATLRGQVRRLPKKKAFVGDPTLLQKMRGELEDAITPNPKESEA